MLSIFKTPEGKVHFDEAYDHLLAAWPVPYITIELPTSHGITHVIVSGKADAPPILLLHGMTFNSTMWRDNIAALSSEYRTYCVDVPGDFGRSSVSTVLQSPKDCNHWLNDVLNSLSLTKVHLIGHSMGGWLALNFALEFPAKVDRLVLLAPVGSSWTHCRMLLKVIPTRFKEEKLRGLKTRTLFLVGDEEVIYNAHKAVNRVKNWLPIVEAAIIHKASHCLTSEQAETVNNHILQFLSTQAD